MSNSIYNINPAKKINSTLIQQRMKVFFPFFIYYNNDRWSRLYCKFIQKNINFYSSFIIYIKVIVVSDLKVEFKYSTITSSIQLLKFSVTYSTIQVSSSSIQLFRVFRSTTQLSNYSDIRVQLYCINL